MNSLCSMLLVILYNYILAGDFQFKITELLLAINSESVSNNTALKPDKLLTTQVFLFAATLYQADSWAALETIPRGYCTCSEFLKRLVNIFRRA